MREIFHAVKAAGLDPVYRAARDPRTLVVAAGELAVRPDAHAVGRAEAGGHHGELLAVLVDLHHRASMGRHIAVAAAAAEATSAAAHRAGLDGVKVAGLVRVQIKHKLVEALRAGDLIVETLVMIGGAVVVEVVITRHLITAGSVNDVVDNLQPKRFKPAAGKTRPLEVLQVFGFQALNDPNVAIPCGECGTIAITEKIQSTKAHAAVPRIALRRSKHVRHIRAIRRLAGIHHTLRHNRLGPAVFAGLGKLRRHFRLRQRRKLCGIRLRPAPNAHVKLSSRRALGKVQHDAFAVLHLQLASAGESLHDAVALDDDRGARVYATLRVVQFGNKHRNIRQDFAVANAPHENGLAILLNAAGLLEEIRATDGVVQHNRFIGHITTAPLRLRRGQRPERLRPGIGKAPLRVGPAGGLGGAEALFAGDTRAGTVIAAKADAFVSDVVAGPTGGPAKQIGIKTHERLAPDDDGHALVGDVVFREIGAHSGFRVREIGLEQPREFLLPCRFLGGAGKGGGGEGDEKGENSFHVA